MKLWEALRLLEENPEKVFKSANYNQEEVFINMNADCYKLPSIVIDSKRNWKEVKQPVTWQEALEAWANGNTLKVVTPRNEKTFECQIGDFITPYYLKFGTWYIED